MPFDNIISTPQQHPLPSTAVPFDNPTHTRDSVTPSVMPRGRTEGAAQPRAGAEGAAEGGASSLPHCPGRNVEKLRLQLAKKIEKSGKTYRSLQET